MTRGPIGVIGGMGPAATVDFVGKVLAETPAQDDEDHVPLLISADPRIPRRPAAILQGGASPLPTLLRIRDTLLRAGVSALVMPCNTAHHWYADLTLDCPVPFLSIVEAGCREVRRVSPAGSAVAVLATRATQAARLFDEPLARDGYRLLAPSEAHEERWLLPAIAAVKAGRTADAAALLGDLLHELADDGASSVLLACTELPIAVSMADASLAARCIDTTRALARATVDHWRAQAADQNG